MRTTRKNLDGAPWNEALADCIEGVRERVVGEGPPTRFGVEGVFFDAGVKLVVYGEINARTIPRLETILEGLLMLRPAKVTVEMTEPIGTATRRWIAGREDGVVAFLSSAATLDAGSIVEAAEHADVLAS